MTGKSIALFVAAALAEIGGAYLVWVGLRDDKGPLVTALGVVALGLLLLALAAALVPVRRAMAIDPAAAIRRD